MQPVNPTQIACNADVIPPVYNAQDLTKGNALAHIKLDDKLYVLRITRAGKLILTK